MKYEDWEREYMRDVIYLGEMKLDLEASWRKEEELKRKPAKLIIKHETKSNHRALLRTSRERLNSRTRILIETNRGKLRFKSLV